MSVESTAMVTASAYFEQAGYHVEDVSHKRGPHGHDLVATKDGERLCIEVKGCTREWQIPDPYVTEFDADRRLVADLLCVVYLLPRHQPAICVIPREAIPPEYVTPKHGYRISSRFKKREVLEQYMHRLDLNDESKNR